MKVGILGGGQLGRMLALAAHRLGMDPIVLEPRPGCAAAPVARILEADYVDRWALEELAACDVVTYEFENVPIEAVRALSARVPVRPGPAALEQSSDRAIEKRLLQSLGIPTARFREVDSREALQAAVAEIGLPAVLKTRRFGYDGRGQRILHRPDQLEDSWRELGGEALIVEERVDFEREVSLVAVRGADGEIRFWPPSENGHEDGILRIARAPAPGVGADASARARERVESLLRHLDYVGVLTVEFFVCGERWLANEIACRVHNSGHWTIEASVTSQFENHLRAVAGLPLGSTHCPRSAAMLNLIERMPPVRELLAIPGASLHDYGKAPAPGRKLGHLTLCDDSALALDRRLEAVVGRLGDPPLEAALRRRWRPGSSAPAALPDRSRRSAAPGA